ncbi:hypothetical protein FDP41_008093 [Naegleria fowleri]|uniref:LPG0439 HIT-related domain-containing protein n=1 Tax=Naegleria fowleri TaxID=5763 RepID=A0A6A5BKK3_NAEFO|nr:uncharacterized protein FDP41_008093 [Naegleria fowleri]KAF0973389.1 hypothetical protein FDP41_008093 [Naegleria fowleri]CAG4710844.1 unnamed protein product [Naegleria fowleri]
MSKLYFDKSYPSTHWVMQPFTLSDPKVICLIKFKSKCEYVVHLNPTDRRGYRSIVRFINNQDMASTFNRDYTTTERIGLALSLQFIAEAYSKICPISQIAVAGNNSHHVDLENHLVLMGHEDEPSFLHGHVWARGFPNEQYVQDVELGGPMPGEIFDMRATAKEVRGNECMILWKEQEMANVVKRVKLELSQIRQEYEEQGLNIQL